MYASVFCLFCHLFLVGPIAVAYVHDTNEETDCYVTKDFLDIITPIPSIPSLIDEFYNEDDVTEIKKRATGVTLVPVSTGGTVPVSTGGILPVSTVAMSTEECQLEGEVTFGGNVRAKGAVTIVGQSGNGFDERLSQLPFTAGSTGFVTPVEFIPVDRPCDDMVQGKDTSWTPIANVRASGKVTIAGTFGASDNFFSHTQLPYRPVVRINALAPYSNNNKFGVPFYGFVPAYGQVRVGANFDNYRPWDFWNQIIPNTGIPSVMVENLDNIHNVMEETQFGGLVPAGGKVTIAARFGDNENMTHRQTFTNPAAIPSIAEAVPCLPPVVLPTFVPPVYPQLPPMVIVPSVAEYCDAFCGAEIVPISGQMEFAGAVPAFGTVTVVGNSY